MGWTNCTITLNSDSTGNLYAGDIVTGTVILELEKDQRIDRVDFKVVGKSKASWSRSAPTIPYIKIYSEKKRVLDILIKDIFREVSWGKMMQAGVYQYTFHFVLPRDLPSSFEGSIGKTIYYIKIKSKPSHKIKNSTEFSVLGNINLNHIEEMLTPCVHNFSKTFWKGGSFNMSIRTYRAFASKQTIPIEVTINNEKRVKIFKIIATLIQKVRYTVSSGYADEENHMCKVEHSKFTHNIAEICYIHMEIPEIVPSSLQLTSSEPMIDISYVIGIDVIFFFHLNQHETIPVNVTTAPVIHHSF